MRTRRLGSSGPEVSVLGFGAWAAGGPWKFGWGQQDDDDSIAAIRHAIENGVNWIDTAAAYGLGHSEEVVREALDGFEPGEEVFVFTKCGVNWHEGSREDPVRTLRPGAIRHECEGSLRRLGVERIDLLQFHWPDEESGTPIEESWATMSDLVDEGKVRWAGVSNFGVELLDRCEPIRHVDSVQPPLNLINPEARNEVIPWCERNGTGAIVYSPMASGLLTGAFDRSRAQQLPADDWRRTDEDFLEPRLTHNLDLVDELEVVAGEAETEVPALAVAWALAVPGVTGAIVGARTPKQVDGWLPAGDLNIPVWALEEIEEVLKRRH